MAAFGPTKFLPMYSVPTEPAGDRGLRPYQSLADVPSQTVGAGLLAKASAQAMIFWLTEYISIPAVTAT
jgi:hypothetical protein